MPQGSRPGRKSSSAAERVAVTKPVRDLSLWLPGEEDIEITLRNLFCLVPPKALPVPGRTASVNPCLLRKHFFAPVKLGEIERLFGEVITTR